MNELTLITASKQDAERKQEEEKMWEKTKKNKSRQPSLKGGGRETEVKPLIILSKLNSKKINDADDEREEQEYGTTNPEYGNESNSPESLNLYNNWHPT